MKKLALQGLLTIAIVASCVSAVVMVGHLLAAISIEHPVWVVVIVVSFVLLYPAGIVASSMLDLREERQRKKEWDDFVFRNHKINSYKSVTKDYGNEK